MLDDYNVRVRLAGNYIVLGVRLLDLLLGDCGLSKQTRF